MPAGFMSVASLTLEIAHNEGRIVKPIYTATPISSDLCTVAIGECVHMGLPPDHTYTLHVSKNLASSARDLVRYLLAGTADNPLVPHINIQVWDEMGPYEWAIEGGGAVFGSKGAGA